MGQAKFKIYEKSGWRWRLVDGNGETIAISEPYVSESNAERGAQNVKDTASNATVESA